MKDTPNIRMVNALTKINISVEQFAEEANVVVSDVHEVTNNPYMNIPTQWLLVLRKHYINLNWLLDGKGFMFVYEIDINKKPIKKLSIVKKDKYVL